MVRECLHVGLALNCLNWLSLANTLKGINCRFAGKERDKILLVDDTIKMIYPLFIREPFRTRGGEVFRMAAVEYFTGSHHVDEFEEQAKTVPEP